jgi:hypothetical protein
MGAVVLRTYVFVAQPPASNEPAMMHVVARKTLIVSKPQHNFSNSTAVVQILSMRVAEVPETVFGCKDYARHQGFCGIL